MSKRQLQQQQNVLNDIQLDDLDDLMEYQTKPNLFEDLTDDFQDLMSSKPVLRSCIESFFNSVVDEITLGIIFDVHRKGKTNAYCLEADANVDNDQEPNKTELFQPNLVKSVPKCVCPNCDRPVAPHRFSWHLAKCMGILDTNRSLRNTSRRVVTTNKDKGDTSPYAELASDDDDDDEDWGSRKNNKKREKNGAKKNKGTPKKSSEHDSADSLNVDVEGGYEDTTNLRFVVDQGRRMYPVDMHDRRSNSSSPMENSPSTPTKKRDKSKSRSKDRGSPSTSLSFD